MDEDRGDRKRSRLDPAKHLPTPLTSFVGRSHELSELCGVLARNKLVTLTGAGGCGKSRLALQLATEMIEDFPDGAWWAELAPVSQREPVAPVLAQALGVRPGLGETPLEAVVAYLGAAQALLVLDNCEHVIDDVARTAEALARGCASLRLVMTSREPLRAEGETEWRVPSMSLPDGDSEPREAEDSDAVRLFVERASQVRPGFRLGRENAGAVVTICREVDGIPLAIELAAARLRAFSADQIAGGLADRFRLLAGGPRTALPRQQTLRASVDWSYELLSDQERAVLRRLGVFVGGFTLDAAARVCHDEQIRGDDVVGLLASLVEKSLVQAEERGGHVRYRLLETVRHYALERLPDADEADGTRDRHRDFYLALAERIEPELLSSRQPESLDTLDPEAANFGAAIERAAATEPEKALQLVVALTLWWRLRGLVPQAEAGFGLAIEAAPEPSTLRPRAMWGRALVLTFAGALDEALPAAYQALDAAAALGDDATMSRALWLIGIATMWVDPASSRPGLERARDLADASGDDFALMHATQALGMSFVLQDDLRGGMPFHEEARRLAERLGQQDALAWYWTAVALGAWIGGDFATVDVARERILAHAGGVGDVVTELGAAGAFGLVAVETGRAHAARAQMDEIRQRATAKGGALVLPIVDLVLAIADSVDGDLEKAGSVLEPLVERWAGFTYALVHGQATLAEVRRLLGDSGGARAAAATAHEVASRVGNQPCAAEAQLVLGRLAAASDEWGEAQRLLHEALRVAVDYGWPRVPLVLEALAEVAAGLENHDEAVRLLGAASRHRRQLGLVPWQHQETEVRALEARLQQALGPNAFTSTLAEGEALTADEAVAYVRRARGKRKRPSAGWESLTPTEGEVARHAAAGLTNPEIAERMFISRGTVRTHLSHIFAKLGLKNRAELAREMTRRSVEPDKHHTLPRTPPRV